MSLTEEDTATPVFMEVDIALFSPMDPSDPPAKALTSYFNPVDTWDPS
jgi:hypothetical protein